ncbi:response regulator transcription factor [Niallia circulans]|uniref:response regulator transcription factor n=1 Tax=Niallia circulans TaxID=1397 RepID=UPI002467D65C|nr:response regulator transcription factor [Niallia circulans]MED3837402.1 response regulator transcription factor [Niallia circulans]MED4244580.1 response regulator transcription factor [Niallia circulans]MED4249936.1 response regulator transcription factor [Niallia circulans]MED5098783.1 response regulator transcription factor [Niallia circulans]
MRGNVLYNVLIVDDHLVVREGLKLMIETNDMFRVIGEAENGEIALHLIEELSPDVILMDLNMPILSGLDTIKKLNERNISIPVIILTTYNEDNLILEGINLGAKGYLLKDTTRENLFRTIEAAVKGETLLQPNILNTILNFKDTQKNNQKSSQSILTDKETFILQAIAKGFRTKDVAFDMGIAERTVKAHLTNIYNKLGVNTRTEAVAISIEKGYIHL